jgi:hypothetical protein
MLGRRGSLAGLCFWGCTPSKGFSRYSLSQLIAHALPLSTVTFMEGQQHAFMLQSSRYLNIADPLIDWSVIEWKGALECPHIL